MKPSQIPDLTDKQIKRFWQKVAKGEATECWPWLGAVSSVGYGTWAPSALHYGLKPHRVAYHLIVGKIQTDLTIDHLCMNKLCCNPAHLEPVTQSENTKRYQRSIPQSPYCKRGHQREPGTVCKVCRYLASTAWRLEHPELSRAHNRASYYRIGKATRQKKQ